MTIRFDPKADHPLIAAANRDEYYSRPSNPPTMIGEKPDVFAPKDLDSGGTWFGVNEWGLVAAITNIHYHKKQETSAATRSRGLLTLDALKCRDVNEVRKVIPQNITEENYDFFNLFVASTTQAVIFTYTGDLNEYILTTKTTTILNDPYNPEKKTSYEISPFPAEQSKQDSSTYGWLSKTQNLLSQHPEICKHGELYGTRSAQIIVLSKRQPKTQKPLYNDWFWFADEPPCKTKLVEISIPFSYTPDQYITTQTRI